MVWRRYDCTCNHRDPAACVRTGPVCCVTDAAKVCHERKIELTLTTFMQHSTCRVLSCACPEWSG